MSFRPTAKKKTASVQTAKIAKGKLNDDTANKTVRRSLNTIANTANKTARRSVNTIANTTNKTARRSKNTSANTTPARKPCASSSECTRQWRK